MAFNSIHIGDEAKARSLVNALKESVAEIDYAPDYITFETPKQGISEDIAKAAHKLNITNLEYRYYDEQYDTLGSLIIDGNTAVIEHLTRSQYWKERQQDEAIRAWADKAEKKVKALIEQYQDRIERMAQWEAYWDEVAYPEFRAIEPYEWEVQDIPNDMYRDQLENADSRS